MDRVVGPGARRRRLLDAAGRAVLPGFVDSHAHLVFAGERTRRVRGADGGPPLRGRRHQVHGRRRPGPPPTRSCARGCAGWRARCSRQGTTTFECKSGYGLTVADEARSVALAAEVTAEVTFLGAHVVPPEFAADASGYVDLVRGPMLERVRAALRAGPTCSASAARSARTRRARC